MVVYVTVYSHKHGEDVYVFDSAEKAERHREACAQEWWEHEMDKPMPEAEPPSVIADMYFDALANRWDNPEHFEIRVIEVQ